MSILKTKYFSGCGYTNPKVKIERPFCIDENMHIGYF